MTFSTFVERLSQFTLCQGITLPDSRKEINFDKHVLPKTFNKEIIYKKLVLTAPAKSNTLIKFTSLDRIKLTLQRKRLECKQLEEEISNMKKALDNDDSHTVSPELSTDFLKLFSQSNKKDGPPFIKLFSQEQQKYITLSSPRCIRHQPVVIKFCLNLAAKSLSAYKDLRYDNKTGTGVLVLPSLRTLRHYKNYIRPTRGFNPDIVNEIAKKTASLSEIERYVAILFDEMKI